jgi:hypothetical protein
MPSSLIRFFRIDRFWVTALFTSRVRSASLNTRVSALPERLGVH